MSRFLSEALGAKEPDFRLKIRHLEKSLGHPNHDIRLTSKVIGATSRKITELGLDPTDTTAKELYHVLNHKLAAGDQQLIKHLRKLAAKEINAEANLSDGLGLFIEQLELPQAFSLKSAVVKRLFKARPPKRAMKALGYRSVDSLLKHEPVPLMLLAANHFESNSYIKDFYASYPQLKSSDFETKVIQFIRPTSRKWQSVLREVTKGTGLHFVLSYELGSVVLFPLDNHSASGELTVIVSELLAELSRLVSISAYLKLHQVSSDFGLKLKTVAEHEPKLKASLLDQPISWSLAQDVLDSAATELNFLHVSSKDLAPTKLMAKLTGLVDELKFWQDSDALGVVMDKQVVSFNLLDVASNLAAESDYEQRQTANFKDALSSELLKPYIQPELITTSLSEDSALEPEASLVEAKAG